MRFVRARIGGLVGVAATALAMTMASNVRADDEKPDWDAARERAIGLVDKADQGGGGLAVAPIYERAGHLLMETFREACDTPVRNSERPKLAKPEKCDEVAFRAARAFAAAHLRAKALTTYREVIIFAQLTGNTTDLAARAMREIALSYQAIAIYDSAAEWHERYANDFPRDADAHVSLSDAAILRLGLGEKEQALKDVDTFVKAYAKSKPKETAAILLMIALEHFDDGAIEKSRVAVTSRMALFDHGPLDLRIRAHALAAKVAPSHAKEEWAIVRQLWADPRTAEQRIRGTWPGEEDWRTDRRLAQVLNAVGDARMAEADEKRAAEVDTLRFPAFTGKSERAGIEGFLANDVKSWLEKKRPAVEATEALYVKVLDVQPIPPPRAVIASGAAVGKMWASMAEDLRAGPAGAPWQRDKALRQVYLDAVAPLLQQARDGRAKPAMKKCVELSVKYQLADSPARDCEAWLVKNFPKEWHAVDEIIPAFRTGPRTQLPSPLPAWLDPP